MLTTDSNSSEKIVIDWLEKHGYIKTAKVASGNYTYLEADSTRRRILVKVLTSYPNVPTITEIQVDEMQYMFEFANYSQRECWSATVHLDNEMKLIGDILWKNLSRLI